MFSPRTPSSVPGYDLENVTTLRCLDDAQSIASQAAGKDVVIAGTSFIGWFPSLLYCLICSSVFIRRRFYIAKVHYAGAHPVFDF